MGVNNEKEPYVGTGPDNLLYERSLHFVVARVTNKTTNPKLRL